MENSQPKAFSFNFDQAPQVPAPPPVEALARLHALDELGRMRRAVEAVGQATYHWMIESDEIHWSNAEPVLGCVPERMASGRQYATMLDAENFTSRYDAVMRTQEIDEGNGVPFEIEYLIHPDGRGGDRAVWIEDLGRWYGGEDGRPIEVFGTVRRIDGRHSREQQLSVTSNCDPLTGLMNRGRLGEALEEAMLVAARDGAPCGFAVVNINNMQVINEAYGFEVADEVIVAIAQRLRTVVRGGDAIARYSGSRFGIILNNCGEDALHFAANRFIAAARDSVIETSRGPVWALLSIGALVLPQHAADANQAMARAEDALSEARRLPSDGYALYQPSAERNAERALNANRAAEIVRCLREDAFRLAFQPVIDATTGVTVMHEALLRMAEGADGMTAAAALIPIAEKLGLIRLIDRAVIQMSIATLDRFPQARLSVNVSGTTAADPRWSPQITEILASNRTVTERLTIEITETVALGDLSETTRFVKALRDLGCGVAIDDFGAGFTSFRNLRALPVTMLKFDGPFCRGLAANSDNQYFVRSLIDLAKRFDLTSVAEWVESEEDAALLRSWGADYLQGNLFGAARLDPPWNRQADRSAPPESAGGLELSNLRKAIEALDRSFKRAAASPAAADQDYKPALPATP